MHGSRKFCQMGQLNSDVFAVVFKSADEGRERILVPLKADHHRPARETPLNGVSLAGRWWPSIECWLGSFVIFQGIWTTIAKEPYSFVIVQEGGGGSGLPVTPSGSKHE